MAPPATQTEALILSQFLLPPAPLPTIVTLKQFTALFPTSLHSSPQIRALYRDLQAQRQRLTDSVEKHIQAEVRRGNLQRREVVSERRRQEEGRGNGAGGEDIEEDEEEGIEQAMFGQSSNLPTAPRSHTLKSIIPALEEAADELEDEIRRLEEEAERLLEEARSTVGGLSDLRYGRFGNKQLVGQVTEGLERLERACEEKGGSAGGEK